MLLLIRIRIVKMSLLKRVILVDHETERERSKFAPSMRVYKGVTLRTKHQCNWRPYNDNMKLVSSPNDTLTNGFVVYVAIQQIYCYIVQQGYS